MIVDLKSHVVALIAIFLSLALGIFIGSTIMSDDYLLAEQEKLIERLEKDFSRLRADNKRYKQEIANLKQALNSNLQFQNAVLPALIGGALNGKRVALIRTGNQGDLDELLRVLRLTGAEVTSVTDIAMEGEVLTTLANAFEEAEEPIKKPAPSLAELLISSLLPPGDPTALELLEKSGAIKKSGVYGTIVDALVISSTGGISPQQIITPSGADTLKKLGVTVVGVERSDASRSYVPYYRSLDVSTVDNIETAPGLFALIYVLKGQKGHYGVKPTATALVPLPPPPN